MAVTAAHRGHLVRATDISIGLIRRAAQRLSPYRGCSAEVMDATSLQYSDDEFDAALSMLGVLHLGKAVPKWLGWCDLVASSVWCTGRARWAQGSFSCPWPVPSIAWKTPRSETSRSP
ncbi:MULTISPECIES: class I SAM-dependent methyltransferase [Amycolatopsis]|uniref:class I SAM-dependent methyltransferase n=1 Tax=Amycolatopsis TaxID=1813 RepID=UPI00117850B4